MTTIPLTGTPMALTDATGFLDYGVMGILLAVLAGAGIILREALRRADDRRAKNDAIEQERRAKQDQFMQDLVAGARAEQAASVLAYKELTLQATQANERTAAVMQELSDSLQAHEIGAQDRHRTTEKHADDRRDTILESLK